MNNSVAHINPELAKEWSKKNKELKPSMVSIGSHKKVIWKCNKGHEWIASVKSRAICGTGCPYCSHNKVLEGFNDLATKYPKLAEEWSERNYPLLPTQVTPYSNKKVWWKCKECGKEWNTLIPTRTYGSKCPYCSGQILLKGFNDLETKYPELAEEWSERNKPLTPDMINEKSRKNVWWKCKKCGYEWKAVVKSRVDGLSCPVCADRTVLEGYNDLASTDKELLSQWDYELNKDIKPTEVSRNSMRIVWWKCSLGHSWRAKISERTIDKKGCTICESMYREVFSKLIISYYARMKGLSVIENDEKTIGIPLEIYIPEEKLVFETKKDNEKIEKLKDYLCEKRDITIMKVSFKSSETYIDYANKIKKSFRKAHIFISTETENDVQNVKKIYEKWVKNQIKIPPKY